MNNMMNDEIVEITTLTGNIKTRKSTLNFFSCHSNNYFGRTKSEMRYALNWIRNNKNIKYDKIDPTFLETMILLGMTCILDYSVCVFNIGGMNIMIRKDVAQQFHFFSGFIEINNNVNSLFIDRDPISFMKLLQCVEECKPFPIDCDDDASFFGISDYLSKCRICRKTSEVFMKKCCFVLCKRCGSEKICNICGNEILLNKSLFTQTTCCENGFREFQQLSQCFEKNNKNPTITLYGQNNHDILHTNITYRNYICQYLKKNVWTTPLQMKCDYLDFFICSIDINLYICDKWMICNILNEITISINNFSLSVSGNTIFISDIIENNMFYIDNINIDNTRLTFILPFPSQHICHAIPSYLFTKEYNSNLLCVINDHYIPFINNITFMVREHYVSNDNLSHNTLPDKKLMNCFIYQESLVENFICLSRKNVSIDISSSIFSRTKDLIILIQNQNNNEDTVYLNFINIIRDDKLIMSISGHHAASLNYLLYKNKITTSKLKIFMVPFDLFLSSREKSTGGLEPHKKLKLVLDIDKGNYKIIVISRQFVNIYFCNNDASISH